MALDPNRRRNRVGDPLCERLREQQMKETPRA
jgi:hypothetical protein